MDAPGFVGAAVCISTIAIEGVVRGLRGRRRPKSDNELQRNAMAVVAGFQFLNIGIVVLLAGLNIKLPGAGNFLKLADGPYDDFSPEWC